MSKVYVVEYGSSYSDDPWDVVCVFSSLEEAKEKIKEEQFPKLFHITEVDMYNTSMKTKPLKDFDVNYIG